MKIVEPFIQTKRRGVTQRGIPPAGEQFVVQMGCAGPAAEAAVRAIVALGKRQKVGRRLGASAVIKAERR